jgi:hypothetical protein
MPSKSKVSAAFNSPVGFAIWSALEKPKNTEPDSNKPARLRYELNIAVKKTKANNEKIAKMKKFAQDFVKKEALQLTAKKKAEMLEGLIMDGDQKYEEKLEEFDGDTEKIQGYARVKGCWVIKGRSSYVIPAKDENSNEYRENVPEKIFYNGMICRGLFHLYSSDASGKMGVYSSADAALKLSDAERISSAGVDLDKAFDETDDDELSLYQDLIDGANETDVAVTDHTASADLDSEAEEAETEDDGAGDLF